MPLPPLLQALTRVLFSLDISEAACRTTTTTLQRNVPRQFNSVVQSDLLSAVRLTGAVDVLVFNPPYVPTDNEDLWAGGLERAWAGGGMGMETTWKVLDSLSVTPLFVWC
jgi:release factor glutamine methyltransferase